LKNEDYIELGAGAGKLAALQSALSGLPGVREVRDYDQYVQVYFEKEVADLSEVNRYCFDKGVVLSHLQLRKRSLESKFMELTKVK
jgi:ABC-2 type transport system ATP-binding protein